MTEPRDRVLSLLAAAGRLANPNDPLGQEARARLLQVTALSPAGIEVGLREHLEVSATEAELSSLIEVAGTAPRVHVILSANVFTGAVRALALALAASAEVYVRPSRREAVVAPLLAHALDEAKAVTRVHLVDEIAPLSGDEVHVYGRDETIRALRAKLSADIRLRGHGTGFGLALIEATTDLDRAAEALARDIVPFDQRGCLSPRVAFAPASIAEAFASRLATALEAAHQRVPRGQVFEDERAEAAVWMSTVAMTGGLHRGPWGAVGLDLSARTLLLPPVARHLHVTAVHDAEHLSQLLSRLAHFVTTLGASAPGPLLEAARNLAKGARLAPLGVMQRPPLDGPVDRR